MAKKDVQLDVGALISEVKVSQAAKDRILRLRAELLDLRAQFDTLGGRLEKATDYREREGLLLSQREAANRMASLERRLGYTPEKMANVLSLRSGLNTALSENRARERAGIRVAASVEAKRKKQQELYDWLLQAIDDLNDPNIDQTRPATQLARRYVGNLAGRLITTPGAEEALGQAKMTRVADFYDKYVAELKANTKATKGLTGSIHNAMIAGSAGIAFGAMLSSSATRILGDRDTGFTQIRDEINKGIKYAGGVIGAAAGYALSSVLGPLGPIIGGAIGSIAGGYAERSKAAATVGKTDSIEMLRMRNLYGSKAGSYFMMRLMNQEGYATAADFQGLASASNVAPYAAGFGKISEDQWTALSFMPNYFNALFSGGTPEQLMDAYRKDMQILGPGMGQLMTSMAGGLGPTENLRAFVNSDQYLNWKSARGQMLGYDTELAEYAPGYERAVHNEAKDNRRVEAFSIRRGTWTTDKFNYDPYGNAGVKNTFGKSYNQSALPMFDLNTMRFMDRSYNTALGETEAYTPRELNIYIEDKRVKVGTVYTRNDEASMHNYATYTVGSNQ